VSVEEEARGGIQIRAGNFDEKIGRTIIVVVSYQRIN